MKNLVQRLRHNTQEIVAAALLIALLIGYFSIHPRGLTIGTSTIWFNQVFVLAVVAAGQAVVVFTRSLDLSVGAILALSNCVAAQLIDGSPGMIALGLVATLAAGAACGLVNGIAVVYGRVQPIIATLATGALFTGIALAVLPSPGGRVSIELSDALTFDLFGLIPTSAVLLLVCIAVIWGSVRNRMVGRTIYAVGSNPNGAFVSGLAVDRAKVAAYVIAGVFAAIGGIFLGLQTLSGDPNVGLPYTLNSIAAVVIGGVALTGGKGTVLGAVVGALILQTIGAMLFFTGVPPLAQPLVQGLVLAIAITLGSLHILKHRNRLEVFS